MARLDRFCPNLSTQNPVNAAFQLYTTVPSYLAIRVPSGLALQKAVVLPLALATAAAGLYPENLLDLPLPSTSPTKTGRSILMWGGSSSVGSCAVQLAVASGVRVVSTASVTNHAFVKAMGAEMVFDYKSETVVEDIVKALEGKELAGVYDAISETTSFDAIAAILTKLEAKVPVATVLPAGGDLVRFGAVFGTSALLYHPAHTHPTNASNSHSLSNLPRT